jgi:hypothetical protein
MGSHGGHREDKHRGISAPSLCGADFQSAFLYELLGTPTFMLAGLEKQCSHGVHGGNTKNEIGEK